MTAAQGSGDMWMTGPEVCKMIRCNENQLYKLNAQGAFPVYKRGKHCLYLYSEVNNWLLNQDTRIRDNPSLHRNLPVEELPKVWPPNNWPLQPEEDRSKSSRGAPENEDQPEQKSA